METVEKYGKQNTALENYLMLLNTEPKENQIKINSQAKNSKYLSINYIERLLDEHYNGLWQTSNFRWQVIANEIVGSIDLQVYHPILQNWITRTGSASVMILTASGMPAVVENKIKNTLVKDFPHLKSECIKNAAKGLGVAFGRNLNRQDDNEFESLSEKIETFDEKKELLSKAWELVQDDMRYTDKAVAFKKLQKLSIEKLKNYIKLQQNDSTEV